MNPSFTAGSRERPMPVEWCALGLALHMALAEPAPEEQAPPDAELLEFLAGWETATGQWDETMTDENNALPPDAQPEETPHE